MQLEFGFVLGPADGRYLIRASPDAPAERVIVLNTLGAPQRRLLGRSRGRRVETEQPEPAPVPTGRVTVARAEPFAGEAEASEWLKALRGDRDARAAEVEGAVEVVNRVLRAYRAVVADPFVREVRSEHAVARRVGYAEGVAVAAGRLDALLEVSPPEARRQRAERLSPQERLAATLGGRARVLACEELVLRARLDLDARRGREAALQARIALEALLAELASDAALERGRSELETDREALTGSANAALDGELGEEALAAVQAAVEHMESALARRRAGAG